MCYWCVRWGCTKSPVFWDSHRALQRPDWSTVALCWRHTTAQHSVHSCEFTPLVLTAVMQTALVEGVKELRTEGSPYVSLVNAILHQDCKITGLSTEDRPLQKGRRGRGAPLQSLIPAEQHHRL